MGRTLALCYHALSDGWTADLSARPDRFREQLQTLRRAGYSGVTFTEAVRGAQRGKRVAVTFDDAFASVARLAKPILDELGWPATIYAVGDYAEAATPLRWEGVAHWADTPYAAELASLGWNALRDLAGAGWEVGSHTLTHPHLTQTSDAQLARELAESRTIVEDRLGRPCPSIAYPFGDCDPRVVAATRAAGYQTAAGLPKRWPAETPLEFPRVGVYHRDDLWRFRLKASPLVRAARRRAGR